VANVFDGSVKVLRNAALDGSNSLKFLLETRVKSKSFDTLIDLLGFSFKSYDLK